MQCQDTRLHSYAAVLKPKSKAKAAWQLSPSTHPHLTPQRLAKAGFYHTPGSTEDSLDVVTCFLCKLQLGGWDEGDDPDVEHAKRGGCAWAKLVCERRNGQTIYQTEEDLPSSSTTQASRIATYGKWWPHKAKSGWLPTVPNLARAGFIYSPSSDSPDAVVCPDCNYAVEGWEATDDAWEIHQTKVPHCPFFTATISQTAPPKKARATKSVASSSASSRRTKRTPAPTQTPVPTDPVETEIAQETEPEQPKASTSRTSRRTTKAPLSSEPSRSKRSAKSKAEDSEVEPETDAPTAVEVNVKPKAKPRSTKGSTKSSTKTKTASKAKKAKGKEKAVDEPVNDQEGLQTEDAVPEAETEPEPFTEAESEVEADEPASEAEAPPEPSVESDPPTADESKGTTDGKAKSSRSAPPVIADPPTPKAVHPSTIESSPPPVPAKDTPRARPIRPMSSATKSKASPHAALTRPVLDSSVTQGAVEARRVMVDLLSPKPATSSTGNVETDTPLTAEQENMTVEELVRHEMSVRYSELERQGEESIAKWLERSKAARSRIETV